MTANREAFNHPPAMHSSPESSKASDQRRTSVAAIAGMIEREYQRLGQSDTEVTDVESADSPRHILQPALRAVRLTSPPQSLDEVTPGVVFAELLYDAMRRLEAVPRTIPPSDWLRINRIGSASVRAGLGTLLDDGSIDRSRFFESISRTVKMAHLGASAGVGAEPKELSMYWGRLQVQAESLQVQAMSRYNYLTIQARSVLAGSLRKFVVVTPQYAETAPDGAAECSHDAHRLVEFADSQQAALAYVGYGMQAARGNTRLKTLPSQGEDGWRQYVMSVREANKMQKTEFSPSIENKEA